MDSPMPRAWTRVTERNAKPMRSRWLAWAAFVFEAGDRSQVSGAMIVSDGWVCLLTAFSALVNGCH